MGVMLKLLLALAAAVTASSMQVEHANLNLLQTTVQNKLATKPKNVSSNETSLLPDVMDVLKQPSQVYKAMSSQLASLEARLADAQRQNVELIAAQKAKYESKLKEQHEEIRAIEHTNMVVATEIDSIMKSNSNIRKQADGLSKATNFLKADMESMLGNITTAQEFTDRALEASKQLLDNSSELTVLFELDEQDRIRSKDLAHKHRLKQIGLVEVGVRVAKKQTSIEAPQDLLQSLLSSLGDMSADQNASEVSLKESFEKEYAAGDEKINGLLEEQRQLNETRSSETELQAKLTAAVQHLQKAHDQLVERSKAFRLFASRLGSRPLPDSKSAMSLLQVDKPLSSKPALLQSTKDKVMETKKNVIKTKKKVIF